MWGRQTYLRNFSVFSSYITTALLPVSLAYGLDVNVAPLVPIFWSRVFNRLVDSDALLVDWLCYGLSHCVVFSKDFWQNILTEQVINICKKTEEANNKRPVLYHQVVDRCEVGGPNLVNFWFHINLSKQHCKKSV